MHQHQAGKGSPLLPRMPWTATFRTPLWEEEYELLHNVSDPSPQPSRKVLRHRAIETILANIARRRACLPGLYSLMSRRS
jgi:hypothetical protein